MTHTRRPSLAILFALSLLTVYGCSNESDDPGTTSGPVPGTGGATDTAADGAGPVDSTSGDAEQIEDGESPGTDGGGGIDGATDTMPTDGETDPPSDTDESPTDADGTQTGEDVADAEPETDPLPPPDPPDANPLQDINQDSITTPTKDSGDTGNESYPCCLPDDTCSELPPSNCNSQGGEVAYQENACTDVNCGDFVPTYACCGGGQCSHKTRQKCLKDGEVPRLGRLCDNVGCTGSDARPCCVDPASGPPQCRMLPTGDCTDLGGTSKSGSDCTEVTCGGNSVAACCTDNRCVATTSSDCNDRGGTHYSGEACADVDCT